MSAMKPAPRMATLVGATRFSTGRAEALPHSRPEGLRYIREGNDPTIRNADLQVCPHRSADLQVCPHRSADLQVCPRSRSATRSADDRAVERGQRAVGVHAIDGRIEVWLDVHFEP